MSPWIFKVGRFQFDSPSPFLIMSLSDQHPYSLFFAGGLRSPTLAKAQVEVGNNTNAYLVSTDIVSFVGQTQLPSSFVGQTQLPSSFAGRRVNSRNGVR